MNPIGNPLALLCEELHHGVRECARLVKAFEEFSGGVGVAASPDVGPWAPPDSGEEDETCVGE